MLQLPASMHLQLGEPGGRAHAMLLVLATLPSALAAQDVASPPHIHAATLSSQKVALY
jgi:hypothetical protein